MQHNHVSRRDWLKGIGVGAVALGMSNFVSFAQDQTQENNLMSITVNGVEIHYQTRGEGHPLLVLHGYPLDHEVMIGALEPAFENRSGYQRIYPDFPGFGFSPVSEQVKNSDGNLRVMTDFIQTLAPDGRYLVSGLSYGGYIAQGMVVQNPEPIDGVLLFAPLVTANDAERDVPEHVVLAQDEDAVAAVPEELAPFILGGTVIQSEHVLNRLNTEFGPSFARLAQVDMNYISELRQPENYSLSFDVRDMDTTFDKPSLIITGRQDSIVGFTHAYEVTQHYSRATYAILDRAGHGLHMEQENLFKTLVNEWLDRVEESM